MVTHSILCFLIFTLLSKNSHQIINPDESLNQKPVYTSGIKTTSYRQNGPFLHHNYSKVYHQNSDRYTHSYDSPHHTQQLFPVYKHQNEGTQQVFVLNGTRIENHENPTRQINKYNKEKRSPKIQVYRMCPKDATGQFVYELSCNQFLNCWKGRGHVQNCAPGTLFNPKTLECDFMEKVYCVSGPRQSILRERSLQNVKQVGCPKDFSGLIPNYTDCSKFINCVSGIENLMDCPSGTLFDINRNICDFAYKATCFNGENRNHARSVNGRLDFADSQKTHESYQLSYKNLEVKCPEGAAGLYKHPYDCSKFLNCDNGVTHIQECGPGTLFNPAIKICDFPYNVRCQNESEIGVVDYDASYYQNNGSKSGNYYNMAYGGFHPYHRNDGNNQFGTYGHNNQFGNGNRDGRYYGSTPFYGNTGYGSSTNRYDTYDRPSYYDQNPYHSSFGQTYHKGSYPYNQHKGAIYQTHYQNPSNTNYYRKGSVYPTNFDNSYHQKGSAYQPNYNYDQQTNYNPNHYPYQKGVGGYDTTYMRPTDPFNQYPSNDNFGSRPRGDPGISTDYQGSSIRPYVGHYDHNRHNQNKGFQPIDCSQCNKGSLDQNPYNHNQNTFYDQRPQIDGNLNWNQQSPTNPKVTPNYDGVVNIGYVRTTARPPFRNSYEPFFGSTSRPKQSFSDYEDIHGHSGKYIRSTTPQSARKQWPPPFPSTDVNADYNFDYDNSAVTLIAENSIANDDGDCGKSFYRCSNDKCISKSFLCDGTKDCPSGEDEKHCLENLAKFSVKKNQKLAVLEKERWNNVSIATCCLLCVEAAKLKCRAFNYRKIDKSCFLLDANEAQTGALIHYSPVDYYEKISDRVDCSRMHVCPNHKCISKNKICDGQDDCGDRTDEKNCKKEDYGYSIKLAGSKNRNEGRVVVTAFGKTGYICDDQFGLRDAHVACKELGFRLGAVEVKGNSYFAKDLYGVETFYMMDDLGCLGNETRLIDCDFSGFGVHNCLSEEIAGVVCKTASERCASDYWQCDSSQECLPLAFVCDGLLDCTDGSDEASQHCDAPTQVRLVNGSSSKEGRLEIRHHGIWGTVCDDDFNEDAGKVVCRQLGYRGAAVVRKDSFFGSGSGPIWLDQVFCSGNESRIENCSHWNWGEHNCDHNEDVGVICGSGDSYEYEERHSMGARAPETASYSYSPDRCGYRNDRIFDQNDEIRFRVVRGSLAKRGDYPWQAALRVKTKTTTSHWCGAVIVSQKFVLTAAHCLIGYAKGAYVVVAGDYNVDEDEGSEQEARIEDFYLHEDFRQGHKMNNDIAVIKLKGRGFLLGGDVQAICLPDANTRYETDENCTISGFGSIESGKSAFSHDLRAGWIPLQKRQVCTMPHVYGDALTEGMFCAGSLDEGVDSCDGDSGGPLACLNNGVFTLYGITSWGQHCGYANKPGVYVKVAHYRKWIDDVLKKYSKT